MLLRIIGPPPFAKDDGGRWVRIATIFPSQRVLITVPGIHATQRLHYQELLEQDRVQRGQPPLTAAEWAAMSASSVDLILDEHTIQIRPDPERMDLAFQADDLLTEDYSAGQVRFLDARHERVYEAIKRRGACWRIASLPTTAAEMQQMIERSRIAIHGRPIYYYDNAAGTRYLTCDEFANLAKLPPNELRQHLVEIQDYSARTNRLGNREVRFFMADQTFLSGDLTFNDFQALTDEQLRSTHQRLRGKFSQAVPPEFRKDDVQDTTWRNRMFTTLIGRRDEVVAEEDLLELASEFYLKIQWLPGARFEHGELILDPVFQPSAPGQPRNPLYEEKVPGFIFNLIREYGDLDYVNIGRVVESLGRRRPAQGRREVYLAALRPRGRSEQYVKVIRMQKWDVLVHLEAGEGMMTAMRHAEEYTDYVLGRRVGCRQLGMNITPQLSAFKIRETYNGWQQQYRGWPIWSTYFERDYVGGVATDKVPTHRFADPDFAARFARLLGAAAAPNLIVGRCLPEGHVVFDDGDEVLIEDPPGVPREILVVEQMGSFQDFSSPLERFAAEYAGPVLRRLPHVSQPEEFATAYVGAFSEHFRHIQREYRLAQKAFDSLFAHSPRDEAGSLAFRWEEILQRLEGADPERLSEIIRDAIRHR